jgi:hypothetical protein
MTTQMFLSLGYLMQGKGHATIGHLSTASRIGKKLGLFGVPEEVGQAIVSRMSTKDKAAAVCPAWGVFNWTV